MDTNGLFKPRLVARSESVDRSTAGNHGGAADVGERLFNEAKKAIERKRQLQLKITQDEKDQMRPTLYRSKTPTSRERAPLYSPSVLKQKAELLETKKAAVELSGCTFRPQLKESTRSSSVPRGSTR